MNNDNPYASPPADSDLVVVMFVFGTLFASLLAFAVLATDLFPGMD